ncbi:AraC family transcriptional regulator [Massilia violaceinigra]|uniref:AraC family transcriptional regulator n=1 Tax=Massilia violaceinigra TaxID=2045208 RepID=A0ABY4A366_9BURK|nr:helix-turn-helix domain-containing protein [Massilia violaceinigra]UOD29097.1 AraC family transcriptional regulator [Massilia violaceinigra]
MGRSASTGFRADALPALARVRTGSRPSIPHRRLVMSSQLLFFISALGAVNGIFLACYQFSRRSHRVTNCVLGALLLAIGFRTAKSTFYYFNPAIAVDILQAGISACLLIGPLSYLYVHCHLADLAKRGAGKHWRAHIMPALCIIGIGIFFPYSRYPHIWHYSVRAIHIYWLFYLILAGKQLWHSRALLLDAHGRIPRQNYLVLSVYASSFLILVAYATTAFTSYIVGAISFTVSMHISFLIYVLQKDGMVEEGKKEKYQNRKLTNDDARALLDALDRAMSEQRLYLNPNLSLPLLAKKVGYLQTTVSQAINEKLDKSFNLYINEFRIQHARQLLTDESHLTMELVAERSGFNSSSTFFAAFKKIAGQTPASYRAASAAQPASSPHDHQLSSPS